MNRTPLTLIALLCFALGMHAQQWTRNITSAKPTFQEVQQAFNAYWEPYQVKDGWYVDDEGVQHKAAGWKQFKRWEHYWQQRTGPTGTFPSNTVECDEWEKYAKDATKGGQQGSPKAASDWSSMGPNTNATGGIGRVNCIAFHPTSANTFWVGTPAGGLWKTTNGGSTWTTSTDNLPVLGVSSIAIHPTTPNTMYIATGDGDAATSLSAFGQPLAGDTKSIGLLKSTNGGTSWTNVLSAEQWEGVLMRKVLIDPAFPDYVYVASNLGVFQSTDAGVSWSLILAGYFIDLEFNPGNSDIVYAATFDASGNAQVYTTVDFGQNWNQTTNLSGVNRIDIAVTPAAPDAVDILCSDASTNAMHSMHYSTNAGASWAPYWLGGPGANLLGYYGDASDNTGQGFYDLALAIDPANYNNILVGGVNTWRTNDGGASWNSSNFWTNSSDYAAPANPQIVHADKHYLAFNPLTPGTLYECNDGGVYKSTNGGLTWTDISNGLVIGQMYSISNAQTSSDVMLAGLQDNGSIGYDQGSWVQVTGGDGMVCHIDPVNPNYVYTSYANGVLYRLTVSPPSFTTISENIPGGQQQGQWVTPYRLDPVDPAVIYAGYEGLYRSGNRGDTWTLQGTPAPGVKMNYLAVAPTNVNTIYAGYLNGLFRSTNGGTSWVNVTSGLPVGSVYLSGVQVDPTDANALLVTLSGYEAAEKVYVSTNGGGTWTNVTATGLPNLPVNCAELDPATGDTYLGTDAGVYVFDTQVSGWVEDNSGLPNVVVTDLDMQHASGLLRAGTFGRGIWETSTLSVGMQEPNANKEIVVYPNPNQGQFTIALGGLLDRVTNVQLMNGLGQVVWHEAGLVNDGGRVWVDAGVLPPGVYLVSVETTRTKHVERLVIEF